MPKKSWKLYLTGGFFLALLVGMPFVLGSVGCGDDQGCELTFADSSTQQICDDQAALSGCDIPAQWSPTTQFCVGQNCDIGCPSSGHGD